MASVFLLAACGGSSGSSDSSNSTSSSSPAEEWVTSTPPGSGTLDSITWDLPYGEPATLDYLQSEAASENTVLANLCESLLHLGPEMTYEPGLAESWESPNSTTWIYDLRPGLKFSDGKPVTTEDVIYSLERNRDPELGSFWEPWYENVKSIKATGKNQVTVKLTKPDVLFNQFLATAGGAVVEKAYVEQKGKKYGTSEGGVMCVGPYKLADWTPGKDITIKANPAYWNKEETPKVDQIEFRFVTNNQTITDGLVSGEIDGAYEVPLTSWPSLASSSSGSGYLGRSTGFAEVNFTEKEGPDQNVDFRRALSLSLDKEAIAKTIYHGAAEPINSEFFPATWGYAADVYKKGYEALPGTTPDLEKAEGTGREGARSADRVVARQRRRRSGQAARGIRPVPGQEGRHLDPADGTAGPAVHLDRLRPGTAQPIRHLAQHVGVSRPRRAGRGRRAHAGLRRGLQLAPATTTRRSTSGSPRPGKRSTRRSGRN